VANTFRIRGKVRFEVGAFCDREMDQVVDSIRDFLNVSVR
jgi:hypothetical protein